MTAVVPSDVFEVRSVSPPLPDRKFPTWLLETIQLHNPDLPTDPATEGVTFVSMDLLTAWQATGGSLMVTPQTNFAPLQQTNAYFGGYRKPDSTIRAIRMASSDLLRRNLRQPTGRNQFIYFNLPRILGNLTTEPKDAVQSSEPSVQAPRRFRSRYTPFIGTSIKSIEQLQGIAARQVTKHLGITLHRNERIAVFLYRSLLHKPDEVRRRKKDAAREECYHGVQDTLGIPEYYMNRELQMEKERGNPAISKFHMRMLGASLGDMRKKKKDGLATPVDNVWIKNIYMWKDREFMAKLDKVFLRAGSQEFPKNSDEILPALQKLGVMLGGLDQYKQPPAHAPEQTDETFRLWEHSKINGKYSIALAEINAALLSAFPEGTPEFFTKNALPYYFAMMAYSYTNDIGVFENYGFEKNDVLGFFKDSPSLPHVTKAFDLHDTQRRASAALLASTLAKNTRPDANFG